MIMEIFGMVVFDIVEIIFVLWRMMFWCLICVLIMKFGMSARNSSGTLNVL